MRKEEEERDSGTVIRFAIKGIPMKLGSCHRQKHLVPSTQEALKELRNILLTKNKI